MTAAADELRALGDALVLVTADLIALGRRFDDLTARTRAHLARRNRTGAIAWGAQADQLAAELREWRKLTDAAEARGLPIRAQMRDMMAATCGDCRAGIAAFATVADSLPILPSATCPQCGRTWHPAVELPLVEARSA